MEEILRFYKELRVVNTGSITDRLLKVTNNDVFLAYDTVRDVYELHSVKSFKRNKMSSNGSISEDMIGGELIELIKINDIDKFGDIIQADRQYMETILDNRSESSHLMDRGKKLLTQTLGREL